MIEDHMKNDQLKPGYNVQIAMENQINLFYSIHQRPTDTRCFIPHLEGLAVSSLPMPKTVIADAGYGSEENYLYVLGEEKTRKYKNDIRNAIYWRYEAHDDWFVCPNDRKVSFKNT